MAILGSAVYFGFFSDNGFDTTSPMSVQERIELHQKNPVLTERFLLDLAQLKQGASIYECKQFVEYFQDQRLDLTGEIYSVHEDYTLTFNDYNGLKKHPYYTIHLILSNGSFDTVSLFCYVPNPSGETLWPAHLRKGETITVTGIFNASSSGRKTTLDPCALAETKNG